MPNVTPPAETMNEVCDQCGSPMVVKRGRFGKFLACSRFPECTGTRTRRVSEGTFGVNSGYVLGVQILVRSTLDNKTAFIRKAVLFILGYCNQ
jgi:ssDNA-binding Zn-finger/Zn-ribbon topoisomerase 1